MTSPKVGLHCATARDQARCLGPGLRRGDNHLYSTNSELTLSPSQILRIVSANSSATLTTRTFFDASASGPSGMVSVTTSSSITEASILPTAGPDNTGCVQ